jgi:hypothetical protein
MKVVRRLMAGVTLGLLAMAIGSLSAEAATNDSPPTVIQISPLRVNPVLQPNIMILGQHLSATTTVMVGGFPATVVTAPDAYHLLVRLPDHLAQGVYSIEVMNEAGTAFASDDLIVDTSTKPNPLKILFASGFVALLLLVMKMSRLPGLA